MRILCYGDSDTYGHDPRSPLGKPYPPDVRWTDRLARATGWEVLNAGLNGREIPHLPGELRDAEALFAAASPFDQAVVFLGSNDMMQGLSAQEVAARMEAFLGRLTAYPLLLLTPGPLVSGTWVTEERLVTESAKLADYYKALARRLGIHYANPGAWDIEMAFDGVHYSEEGHRVFALRMQDTLESISSHTMP